MSPKGYPSRPIISQNAGKRRFDLDQSSNLALQMDIPIMAKATKMHVKVALREGDEIAVAECFRIIQYRDNIWRNSQQNDI